MIFSLEAVSVFTNVLLSASAICEIKPIAAGSVQVIKPLISDTGI